MQCPGLNQSNLILRVKFVEFSVKKLTLTLTRMVMIGLEKILIFLLSLYTCKAQHVGVHLRTFVKLIPSVITVKRLNLNCVFDKVKNPKNLALKN